MNIKQVDTYIIEKNDETLLVIFPIRNTICRNNNLIDMNPY